MELKRTSHTIGPCHYYAPQAGWPLYLRRIDLAEWFAEHPAKLSLELASWEQSDQGEVTCDHQTATELSQALWRYTTWLVRNNRAKLEEIVSTPIVDFNGQLMLFGE